jgi:hypothetical protein
MSSEARGLADRLGARGPARGGMQVRGAAGPAAGMGARQNGAGMGMGMGTGRGMGPGQQQMGMNQMGGCLLLRPFPLLNIVTEAKADIRRLPTWLPAQHDATWLSTIFQSRSTGDDGANDDDASEHGSNGRNDAKDGRGELNTLLLRRTKTRLTCKGERGGPSAIIIWRVCRTPRTPTTSQSAPWDQTWLSFCLSHQTQNIINTWPYPR